MSFDQKVFVLRMDLPEILRRLRGNLHHLSLQSLLPVHFSIALGDYTAVGGTQ